MTRNSFFVNSSNSRYLLSILLSVLLLLAACKNRVRQAADSPMPSSTALSPRYAAGFDVAEREGYLLLSLRDPQDSEGEVTRFALVPRGTSPVVEDNCRRIETPVRSVICMTSLQLSNFIALGRTDAVVGVTSTRHLHNPEMRARIADGQTRKIGIEGNFDNEVIMGIAPDLIIISPYKRGGYDALREVGIPLLPHFGYKEPSPLGQAEWIRCMGLLLDCREVADSLFAGIEERYGRLCELTADVDQRPTVLSGELRNGNWYAVGGASYLARIFSDAGADYFLRGDSRSGGVTLDFEQAYAGASDARYWRILNSFDGVFSYDDLRRDDPRYADFRAWKERGIIYCNMTDVPFYENTPTEPDVVLADMIKVFHPDLLPDHEPVYYKLLK